MDPFLTTYRKEYTPKSSRRPDPVGMYAEFKDPVAEGFKNYLQLSSAPTPPEAPIEDADKFLKKQEELKPKITKMYFETPVNNEIMTRAFIFNGRSEYQVDYCDLEKDEEYKEELRRKNMYRLPDDWDIPLTTQKYYYRNPIVINSRAMEQVKQIRTPNNLDAEEHIRKILKVTTGKTEYGGVIGDLGELIINDHLHGKIVHQKCTCAEHNPQDEKTEST